MSGKMLEAFSPKKGWGIWPLSTNQQANKTARCSLGFWWVYSHSSSSLPASSWQAHAALARSVVDFPASQNDNCALMLGRISSIASEYQKLTWIPEITIFDRRYILKTIILGIYVRCRGGNYKHQVIQAVTFWSPIVGGHRCNHVKGHLNLSITKRSQSQNCQACNVLYTACNDIEYLITCMYMQVSATSVLRQGVSSFHPQCKASIPYVSRNNIYIYYIIIY